jgi:hypothetical protein
MYLVNLFYVVSHVQVQPGAYHLRSPMLPTYPAMLRLKEFVRDRYDRLFRISGRGKKSSRTFTASNKIIKLFLPHY